MQYFGGSYKYHLNLDFAKFIIVSRLITKGIKTMYTFETEKGRRNEKMGGFFNTKKWEKKKRVGLIETQNKMAEINPNISVKHNILDCPTL